MPSSRERERDVIKRKDPIWTGMIARMHDYSARRVQFIYLVVNATL